jgi:hypothetical protein
MAWTTQYQQYDQFKIQILHTVNLDDAIHLGHVNTNSTSITLNDVSIFLFVYLKRPNVHTPWKWPSKLVAPEYGMMGIRYFVAISTTFTTSSVDRGKMTTL